MNVLAWLRGRLRREDPPLAEARWVVVDCETSGLDLQADRVLSIGAVRMEGGRIVVGDAFSVLLRQKEESTPGNIVIHGIGGEAQRGGVAPAEALADFERHAGDAVLVGFHAHFDRTMLERAMREHRGEAWRRRWIDLAQLLPALFPSRARACKALDDWLRALEIGVEDRHEALADAVATAQLFQVALAEATRQGVTGTRGLLRLAADARWAGG